MLSPWRAEFSFILLALLLGGFFGKLFDHLGVAFWVCLFAYLGRHLFYANRLILWVRSGRAGQPPQGSGVWEEIYYLIYRLRRRNKRRKKQLIRMLERFRTATAALPDATVVLGPRDEIDWFNAAAERLLGLRRGDTGQQIGNLLRSPRFSQYLNAHDYESTVGIASPVSGNLQLEIRIVPYGKNLRLLVAQDVTQLRFMERVRSDFVANVSHELRTPLTVLKGYLETLGGSEGKVPDAYLKVFQRMEEQTQRMQNLIDDLLSLTRLESAALRTPHKAVDMASLLAGVCDEARMLDDQGPSIDLRIDTEAGLWGVEQELRSAFSNLVINAVKYTPANGHVMVRWYEEGEGARLDVEDDGPGIAAEHLSRLTERFYRVDLANGKNRTGSGLGLSIVKHVLTRHGAELKITSTPGRGSRFSCCFPAQQVAQREHSISAIQ